MSIEDTQGPFDNIPFNSPVEPRRLTGSDKFNFSCYKGISCFNACCKQADITLTPFDILRLKDRLGLSSTEFLKKHTVPFELDGQGLPGVKLKTEDNNPVCLLLDGDNGCSVYEDRPSACRYYPMGLLNMRAFKSEEEEQYYFMVKEDHCTGHSEDRQITVDEYRKEQGVEEYDEFNWQYYRLILKKKSSGPTIGKPSPASFHFFFTACYDVDRFREFIKTPNFLNVYAIPEDEYQTLLEDDYKLASFGLMLLHQVLFGENTIPLVENAYENRIEERKDIIAAKQQLAEELSKKEEPFKRYMSE
ncbi:YkgJ family cysteine cluster protein [Beggiatoa alba]|nr:YkgJ family cysteine cluster protein [Beggiatoa alba]